MNKTNNNVAIIYNAIKIKLTIEILVALNINAKIIWELPGL